MALSGIKVVEFAGMAPVPFAGMMLADWGASVVRIDRPTNSAGSAPAGDLLTRGKRSIALDLRSPDGLAVAKQLISAADVLLDTFRPGVLEKMGLGPDVFLGEGGLNTRLVYARLSGFEPDGPQREFAGHDLNYLAATGVLHLLPRSADGTPSFPLNLIADFAGGGHLCATGVLVALRERDRSGKGQVVATNMVSGARYLSSYVLAHARDPTSPLFHGGRSMLGGDVPYYAVYRCQDGGFVSVACLEPQFFAAFLRTFHSHFPGEFEVDVQTDVPRWPAFREYLRRGFASKTRDEWAAIFAREKDACVFPVLTPAEAAARSESGSQHKTSVAPHPALSRTPATRAPPPFAPLAPGLHSLEVLRELGVDAARAERWVREGVVGVARGDVASRVSGATDWRKDKTCRTVRHARNGREQRRPHPPADGAPVARHASPSPYFPTAACANAPFRNLRYITKLRRLIDTLSGGRAGRLDDVWA